ncbi:MAG: peptidoglycan-binding protein [Deltaproteobacteria bacterium]|nr:peptidoglycan-binding protein [Deltaproteobacteria bacterium]
MADEPKRPPKPERPSISEQTDIPANVPMTPIGADEELGIFTPASLQRHKAVSGGGILLSTGDYGNAVVELQRELVVLGLLEEPLEDENGKYGARTEEAVRVFQEANGFLVTGKVDNRTRGALRTAARARGA